MSLREKDLGCLILWPQKRDQFLDKDPSTPKCSAEFGARAQFWGRAALRWVVVLSRAHSKLLFMVLAPASTCLHEKAAELSFDCMLHASGGASRVEAFILSVTIAALMEARRLHVSLFLHGDVPARLDIVWRLKMRP